MIGEYNGLWSYVESAAPHAVLLKCTCHSYDLAIKTSYNHKETIPGWFQ